MSGSPHPRLFRLAAVAFGLLLAILALALTEFVLRLFAPQRVREIVIEGESLGIENARVGHLNRPGARAVTTGPEFDFESAISGEGFRDLEDHTAPPDPSRPRILLLGDSFTFGYGSAYPDIWPVRFEADLAGRGLPVEVVKAGVPGFDTLREVRYLEMLLPRYRPAIVVIGFVHHDLSSAAPLDTPQLDGSTVDGGAARGLEGDLKSLHLVIGLKRLLIANDDFFVRRFSRGAHGRLLLAPSSPEDRRRIETTRDLFRHAAEYCASHGSRLVVLSIPQELEVLVEARKSGTSTAEAAAIDAAFEPFAAAHGITWISALPWLARVHRTTGEALYFRTDGHLDRSGNRALARLVADELEPLLRAATCSGPTRLLGASSGARALNRSHG